MAIRDRTDELMDRALEPFLGDGKPWNLRSVWRFVNALIGVTVFSVVGLWTGLVPLVERLESNVERLESNMEALVERTKRMNDPVSPFGPIESDSGVAWVETREAIGDTVGMLRDVQDGEVGQFLDRVVDSYTVVLLAYPVLVVMVAGVIAAGIRRGGPLRFFFLGVTIPGAVIALMRNMLNLGVQ